jgi:hypothetical protein
MPDISYSVSVNVNAGNLSSNLIASNVTSDFSTAGFLALTLSVGTTTQAITTASASTLGLCFARSLNTTTTHTVSFGRLSGTTLFETVRLKGGDAAVLRLAPGSYAAKSSSEGGRLLLQILEE